MQVHDVRGILEVEWEQEGYSKPVWFLSRVDLAMMKELSPVKKGEVPSDSQHPHLPELDRLRVLYGYLHGAEFR